MSAQLDENVFGTGNPGERLAVAPDPVEVRRNAGLMAAIGAVASGVAIAYLGRAAATGRTLDWMLMGVMALIGVIHLTWFVDSRTPLLVADSQGVRLRLGRSWRGLPWGSLRAVEHTPRRGLIKDGSVVLVPHVSEKVLSELDGRGRRQARLSQKMYGAPFAVPLGLTTRIRGLSEDQDLAEALSALAGRGVDVVTLVPQEVEAPEEDHDSLDAATIAVGQPQVDSDEQVEEKPARRALFDPRPALASSISSASALFRFPRRSEDRSVEPDETPDSLVEPDETPDSLVEPDETPLEPPSEVESVESVEPVETIDETDEDLETSPTPAPSRMARFAQRAQLTMRLDRSGADDEEDENDETPARELHRRGSQVSLVEDTQAWGERVRPLARPGSPVAPLVVDEFAAEPADDPVIGPELRAARTRIGLSIDQLAERTRIRPHVIESMEVDDFLPCGGDFYARGHLRTLARVLGIDVAPLLESYRDRYAHAPISPRKVFEAELATGTHGGIRGTRGGPNWSVLVAAVMAVVLAWSVARLVVDGPEEVQQIPGLSSGSGGVSDTAVPSDTIPVLLRAAGGGARVVVRDGDGKVVFTGDLSYGATRPLDVVPPVQVESSDGGLEVVADGSEQGQLGDPGQPASGTFIAR